MRGYHVLREHGVDSDVLCTLNAETAARRRDAKFGDPRGYGSFLTTVFDE